MQNFTKSKICYLKQNKNKIIVFSSIYIIGILLGLFFIGDLSDTSILYANAKNYYFIIFSPHNSIFSAFYKCFVAGLFLSLLTILFSLNTYLIPVISIILFYRGIILGTAFIIFYTISGITGIIIFIILTLPVHITITAGLIFSSVLNYKTCQIKSTKNKIIYASKNALISIAFTLIASFYLIFIIITIIRPINLLF
ncbi:MAG: hypothetical protein IKA99_07410 [Clostridia bacterium]|nr:hypothetical protein [Clostridia bacterium]